MIEKQTTLKQKFEKICKAYATIEEKNRLYYEAVKEWLQQKQKLFTHETTWKQLGYQEAITELLEELEAQK